jgi:hypothetical protein
MYVLLEMLQVYNIDILIKIVAVVVVNILFEDQHFSFRSIILHRKIEFEILARLNLLKICFNCFWFSIPEGFTRAALKIISFCLLTRKTTFQQAEKTFQICSVTTWRIHKCKL